MTVVYCVEITFILLTGNWAKVERVICAEEFDDGLPGRQERKQRVGGRLKIVQILDRGP